MDREVEAVSRTRHGDEAWPVRFHHFHYCAGPVILIIQMHAQSLGLLGTTFYYVQSTLLPNLTAINRFLHASEIAPGTLNLKLDARTMVVYKWYTNCLRWAC